MTNDKYDLIPNTTPQIFNINLADFKLYNFFPSLNCITWDEIKCGRLGEKIFPEKYHIQPIIGSETLRKLHTYFCLNW